jgi:hypothetical protein
MKTEVEQLGEERRLIFENVANGVPIQQVMSAYRRSEKEVMADVEFVGKKITEYRFRKAMPPLSCSTLKDISWNRLALLDTLRGLNDAYLGTSLLIGKIHIGVLDDPHVMQEAKGRGALHLTQVAGR